MISEIQSLSKKLPKPEKSYAWQGVNFDLYIAKNFNTSKWLNQQLKGIVLLCRKSFKRYGNVPLVDEYDKKSLIILVRINYAENNKRLTEWFTLRVISANGKPDMTEDLLLQFENGKKLYDIIKEKFYPNTDGSKSIFTLSRFCGSTVYLQNGLKATDFKRRFTNIAFVLMGFLATENLTSKFADFHLTAMFHHNIMERLKHFEWEGKKAKFNFDEIFDVLGLAPEGLKKLSPGNIAYYYPTYFFRLEQLINWLKVLQNEGKLSAQTFNHYLKNELNWVEIDDHATANKIKVVKKLSGLGALFTAKKKIHDSDLSGDDLRARLNNEVEKTLVLNVFSNKSFEKKIQSFLKDLNFFE